MTIVDNNTAENRTFAYRKRGEPLDGELSFSMTQENERWNGKNGHFFYRFKRKILIIK